MAANIHNWYHSLVESFYGKPDFRTADWPLIRNPAPLLIIVASYLYFVCKCGPEYMRKREPYKLKFVISAYNVGQILACSSIFYTILTSGWLDDLSWGCQPVNISADLKSNKLAEIIWWTVMLKLAGFIETVFFVLRKKQNQVTFLHLYHHVSTLSLSWLFCKYEPGGMASFTFMINSFVHVLMYSYYLLALHGGKKIQDKIYKLKMSMTTIQMIQFFVCIVHASQALKPSCKVNKIIFVIGIAQALSIFYLFYNFYKKTYKKKINKTN